MPRGDRTGPAGLGAATGRGRGYCAGYATPGYAGTLPGRGFGAGFGRGCAVRGRAMDVGGYGWRHMFYATGRAGFGRGGYGLIAKDSEPAAYNQKEALKRRAEALESELSLVNQRLASLGKEGPENP